MRVSYWKRILDTSSRYRYIVDAYASMKNWIQDGTDEELKKKRYIHRHLALPENVHDEDSKELLIQFGYYYVQALLNYCSDDIKPGACLVLLVLAH